MKNHFFKMIIFCLISSVAYPMSIVLDETSKAKLIEQVKKENVARGYWPSDVTVKLVGFCKESDTNYFVRAEGSYNGHILIESDSENKVLLPVRLGKRTASSLRKEELQSWGVLLPE